MVSTGKNERKHGKFQPVVSTGKNGNDASEVMDETDDKCRKSQLKKLIAIIACLARDSEYIKFKNKRSPAFNDDLTI